MVHKLTVKLISTFLKSDILCVLIMSVLKIHFLVTNSKFAFFPHLTIKLLYYHSIKNNTSDLFAFGVMLEFAINYMLVGMGGYSKYFIVQNKFITFILLILLETFQSIYLFDYFIIENGFCLIGIPFLFVLRKIPVCMFLYIRSIHNRVAYNETKEQFTAE